MEVKYHMKLAPVPFLPKSTRCIQNLCITMTPGEHPVITVSRSNTSHDVPYGDKFVVEEHVTLSRDPTGEGVDLTLSARVVFFDSFVLSSRVEAESMKAI